MLKLPKQTDRLLADFISKNDMLSNEQFIQSKNIAEAMDSSVVASVIDMGFLTEDEISNQFAEKFGLQKSKAKLSSLKSRPMADKISDQFVLKNRVVPVDSVGDKVYVVVADPSALESFNSMQVISDSNLVEVSVVGLSDMEEYLERLKGKMDDDFLQSLEAMENEDSSSDIDYTDAAALGAQQDGNIPDYLLGLTEVEEEKPKSTGFKIKAGTDVIDFVDSLISNAIAMGVSDIHVETFRGSSQVRYRKDGVLKLMDEFEEFLTFNFNAVVTRLKILANLDISERRLPQDGAIVSELSDKTVDIRVSILPTVHGERVVMRILDPDAANFTLSELGIPELGLKRFKDAINSPQGLLLVTGPTGSGKSTTLYAGLKEINNDSINIMTAEDPVEYDLKGVGQVQVRDNIGLTFSSALRSFLRQDPEVIMVGEIRDKETGDIAIKASLTGHLVLSTLHTNDAASTITRLINMGIPNYLITSSLSLIVAQRLARVNCPHCLKDDDEVAGETLKDLGFDGMGTCKPQISTGCDRCMDTGVKGRAGIHEILQMNKEIREIIINNGSEQQIVDAAKKAGFLTLQEVGRTLVMEGKISLKEYKRVLVID